MSGATLWKIRLRHSEATIRGTSFAAANLAFTAEPALEMSHATIPNHCNRHPHRHRRRNCEQSLRAAGPCCRGLRKGRWLCETNLQRKQKEGTAEGAQGKSDEAGGSVTPHRTHADLRAAMANPMQDIGKSASRSRTLAVLPAYRLGRLRRKT